MAKLTNFMIGMVMASLFVVLFMNLGAEVSTNYGGTFDNSTFSAYQKLENLTKTAENTRDDIEDDIKTTDGIFDIVGKFFSQAKEVLDNIGLSFDLFEDMISDASDKLYLDDTFRTSITTIVLIFLFIGVILSAIMKWYL